MSTGQSTLARPAQRSARRLRVDAERNRAALLTAAREIFAKKGLDAPLEEIANRAGVGIATLYRRFPTRDQLVAAALIDRIAVYAELAEKALAEEDPWEGFVGFVKQICELQADDRGLSDLLCMTMPGGVRVEELRRIANGRVTGLIKLAKAAGTLRESFVSEDLALLLMGHAAVVQATASEAPNASSRFVALMLEGFRTRDGSNLPPPPTSKEMSRAMRRMAERRGCVPRT